MVSLLRTLDWIMAPIDADAAKRHADSTKRIVTERTARKPISEIDRIRADEKAAKPRKYTGVVATIDHVEMIAMPRAGAILFHVEHGCEKRYCARNILNG